MRNHPSRGIVEQFFRCFAGRPAASRKSDSAAAAGQCRAARPRVLDRGRATAATLSLTGYKIAATSKSANPDAGDALWRIDRKRQAIYARADLPLCDQLAAAATPGALTRRRHLRKDRWRRQ
jgi:hypothetical protein